MRSIGRLWPSVCVVCRRAGKRDLDLCGACLGWLPRLVGVDDILCRHCGERIPDRESSPDAWPGAESPPGSWTNGGRNDRTAPAGTGGVSIGYADDRDTACCEGCAVRSSPFARLVAPWRYDFPLDRLIARMKYRDDRVLARVLGTALAREACRPSDAPPRAMFPDALLAVPSRAVRRDSGFDHAAALARWCARESHLSDASGLAARVIDTGSLAGLSRAERADRIRGAFRVDARVAGLRIAIVDDVLTSGATAGELARELYDTGAAAVELWVLARTPAIR